MFCQSKSLYEEFRQRKFSTFTGTRTYALHHLYLSTSLTLPSRLVEYTYVQSKRYRSFQATNCKFE